LSGVAAAFAAAASFGLALAAGLAAGLASAPAVAAESTAARPSSGAAATRRLAFGTSGHVAAVEVEPGERVKRGATLARLACDERENSLEIAKAEANLARAEYEVKKRAPREEEIAAADARLAAAQAALQDAESDQRRSERLALTNGVISERERAETARRLTQARSEVAAAKMTLELVRSPLHPLEHQYWDARLALSDAFVRRAEAQTRLCTLRAPESGVIVDVLRRPGEYADAADTVVELRPASRD
jgi:HlyD family secretion protein